MYEIVSLQDDPVYRVRKETVLKMMNISKVVGKEIFLGVLFPVYKKLCQDQIWGVRRAAVEVLPLISEMCPEEYKNHQLMEIFKKFTNDPSKWVKMAAFQHLGPFIASFQGSNPSPILIDYYLNMNQQNNNLQDNDSNFHCAFNFPAVLLTLGKQYFQQLEPLYNQLLNDEKWKVRRTLAFSLHEIAKILGNELTEQKLIPVLNKFLIDIREVREGVLANLDKFIKVLSMEQRQKHSQSLVQIQYNFSDWRKRQFYAKQLKKYAKLFNVNIVNQQFVPIFFQLCKDEVFDVRKTTAKATNNFIQKIKYDFDILQEFIIQVKLFYASQKYNERQTFIYMSSSISQDQQIFKDYFINEFCDLANDRIINVRIILSETVNQMFKQYENNMQMQELIIQLQQDKSDISQSVQQLQIQIQQQETIDTYIQQEIILALIDDILK